MKATSAAEEKTSYNIRPYCLQKKIDYSLVFRFLFRFWEVRLSMLLRKAVFCEETTPGLQRSLALVHRRPCVRSVLEEHVRLIRGAASTGEGSGLGLAFKSDHPSPSPRGSLPTDSPPLSLALKNITQFSAIFGHFGVLFCLYHSPKKLIFNMQVKMTPVADTSGWWSFALSRFRGCRFSPRLR